MTETRFGIQFVVTRDGQPITDVMDVKNTPILLHLKHDPSVVWNSQIAVLLELMRGDLKQVDALADIVPDARPVGLQVPPENVLKRKVGVPVLKRVNRVLLWAVKRLSAYNAKRGRHVD